ncbi:hypothetical protein BT96DRAFT_929784, partial [Gymnopus androsaceus JB14]
TRTNNTTLTLAPTSPLKSVLLFPTEPLSVQKRRPFTGEEDRALKAGLVQSGPTIVEDPNRTVVQWI